MAQAGAIFAPKLSRTLSLHTKKNREKEDSTSKGSQGFTFFNLHSRVVKHEALFPNFCAESQENLA
ncbi:hypothetical protein, partial [Porphyromonas loveana]|uniref:hypothetical protein n=1 Tax=Porphyromonas loveana TaxID=1884669 RepID=UPI0035A0A30C